MEFGYLMRFFGCRLSFRSYSWLAALGLVCFMAAGALLPGCSTDVDVNGPYQTRAIVYGLLNPADSVQLIRIEKAFLNIQEPDAFKAARVKDSIYFPLGDNLNVTLIREEANGQQIPLGSLERVETTGKDSGIFHYPDQVVYRFRGKLIPEDSGQLRRLYANNPGFLTRRRIRLVITNSNGYQAIARTKLVYPIFDDQNEPVVDDYRLKNPVRNFGTRILPTIGPSVGFGPNLNGVLFKTIVYAPIEEVDRNGVHDTLEATWTFMGEHEAVAREYSDRLIQVEYRGDAQYAFYELLRETVDTTKDVAYRRLLPVRIRVLAADSMYFSFIQAAGNYSAITQSKPIVTNISNGLGVLASRTEKTYQARINTALDIPRVNAIRRYRSLRLTE